MMHFALLILLLRVGTTAAWSALTHHHAPLRPISRLSPAPARSRSPPVVCLTVGDIVRVVADVNVKGGRNANGMTGKIVKVFGEGDDASDDWGACCELAWGEPTLTVHMHDDDDAKAATVDGYFDFNELKLVHRDANALAAFEESERQRWRDVYDEEWVQTHQELIEGDLVEVVRDVGAKGIANALGMQGVVTDVRTECETDAACCCNELATASVTVRLAAAAPSRREPVVGYFCEDEVELVK